jgi:hypothetical protein
VATWQAEEYLELVQRIDKLTAAHAEVAAARKRDELRAEKCERKHGQQKGASSGASLAPS